jgi:hypothetical protein
MTIEKKLKELKRRVNLAEQGGGGRNGSKNGTKPEC